MNKINEILRKNNAAGLSLSTIKNFKQCDSFQYGTKDGKTDIDENTMYSACSISKLITSILVLISRDEGLLNLDDNVNKHLRNWKLTADNSEYATIEDLLINQSGLVDVENSYCTYDIKTGKSNVYDLIDGKTKYIKEKITIKQKPRTNFIYSDNNFLLLEKLLEDIYTKSYRELAKEKIFTPLEMTNSRFVDYEDLDKYNIALGHDKYRNLVEKNKNIYPYDSVAGLWTTTSDLSKLLLELFKSYNNLNGNKLLKFNSIKDMMTAHGCVDYAGYGVFVYKLRGKDVFYTQGWGEGFQSYTLGFLDDGDGITIMMNQNPGVEQMEGPIGEIVNMYLNSKFSK